MKAHYEKLLQTVQSLRSTGVFLTNPLSVDEIIESLEKLKKPYAADVVELYSLFNGNGDDKSSLLLSIWPINKIVARNGEKILAEGSVLWFADFSIDAQFYGFIKRNDGESSVVIGTKNGNETVAYSAADFFEWLLKDPTHLYVEWERQS